MKSRSNMQSWRGAAIGAAVVTALGLLFLTRLGEPLANLSYELPFRFRPTNHVEGAVVLYMDDESHEYLSQPNYTGWNRAIHAEAIDRLNAMHAAVIVFDLLIEHTTTAEADNALVRAAQRHGKVFFGGTIVPEEKDGLSSARSHPPFTNVLQWGLPEGAEEDKMIRQHLRDTSGLDVPSLAWLAARIHGELPPDDGRVRWMNYYGPPRSLPHFSYWQLFSNGVPAAAISNKPVFIGAQFANERAKVGFTGGVQIDAFRTPYTRWTGTKTAGVEIIATTYLNLLGRVWLTELPGRYQVLLVLLCGAIFGMGLSACRPLFAVLASTLGAAAIGTIAIALMWKTRIWFPWAVLVFVEVPAALAWSVVIHARRIHRQTETLRIQLATAELQLVRGTGELAEARARAQIPRDGALSGAPPIPDHSLVRCIGKGGYGEVWLARDVIGTYHAVKVIYRASFPDASPFEREFRGIQKFTPISRSHSGFVNILHVGRNDTGGYFYYIMELGDDERTGQRIEPDSYAPRNLACELKARGRLAVAECLELAIQLSSALQHLHAQHLIHRDIKPSNIIFVNGMAKFADIGLVTEVAATGQEVTCVGTEGYIAPEGPGTPAADVYSLGKVFYEMCTGFHRDKFPELPTALVEDFGSTGLGGLNKIIVRACEADVRKRFQSGAELHSELKKLPACAP